MLITSHILIRLLKQHYYFLDTWCELLTHYHGYNYHMDRALLFFYHSLPSVKPIFRGGVYIGLLHGNSYSFHMIIYHQNVII